VKRLDKVDKTFMISGIFFLYRFLVRLFRNSGTFCPLCPKIGIGYGHCDEIFRKIHFGGTKNPENIFLCSKNFRKNFLGKSVHALTHNTKLSPTTQKSHFSDVIAIAGCQGHLQPVSPENHTIINAKKGAVKTPLYCTVLFDLKWIFWQNNHFNE